VRQLGRGVITLLFLSALPLVGENAGYQPDPAWQAPEEAAGRQNPLSSKPHLAAGGRKLFIRNCVECHGADGTGLEKKHSADLQLPIVQQQSAPRSSGRLQTETPTGGCRHSASCRNFSDGKLCCTSAL